MSVYLHHQRGVVTLLGAMFVVVSLSVLLLALQRNAGSGLIDTALQHDSVGALFLAESGLERAAGNYNASSSCDSSLAEGPINVGTGSFSIENIGAGFNTDFTGAALPSTDCRIRVSGTVNTHGAQRVVEAIFRKADGNLLVSVNPDFNAPPGACVAPGCTPTGWTLPAGGWDDTGGPDGSRSAYVNKPNNGGSTATTAGAFGLTPFTVTAPTVLSLDFDYRVVTTGNSSKEAQLEFTLSAGATTYNSSPWPFESGNTGVYLPGSVTISIGGTGPVTIDGFSFRIFAKSGKPKQIWLDNLDLQGTGGGGGGTMTLQQWRDIVSN